MREYLFLGEQSLQMKKFQNFWRSQCRTERQTLWTNTQKSVFTCAVRNSLFKSVFLFLFFQYDSGSQFTVNESGSVKFHSRVILGIKSFIVSNLSSEVAYTESAGRMRHTAAN